MIAEKSSSIPDLGYNFLRSYKVMIDDRGNTLARFAP